MNRLEVERDDWTRIYLMNCVRQYKLREAIPALINLLDSSKEAVQKAAGSTLQLLTNQNLGIDSDAWQAWYNKTRNNP